MTEFRLYDDPGADVAEITTDGSTVKPFINSITPLVDECKLQVSESGLSVTAVDPSNVCMAEVELSADAFEQYGVKTDSVVGLNTGAFKNLIRRARKGQDDELTLSLSEREVSATVARGYQNHNVVSQGEMTLIDPDSIRQEPDVPDLDNDIRVNVDAAPFFDALEYAMGVSEYTKLSVKGVNQHTEALYIGGKSDYRNESVAIDNIDAATTAEAMYSNSYVQQALSALTSVSPDVVTVEFDEEFPVSFIAGNEHLSVEYSIAPRVRD